MLSMVAGALIGALSMMFGATLMLPHGRLFVLLISVAISLVIGYIIAIAVGTLLLGVLYSLLKCPDVEGRQLDFLYPNTGRAKVR